MKGQIKTTTRAEAYQRALRKEDCPYVFECGAPITKDYFNRICNSAVFVKCHHFAKRMGELKPPMTWLQRLALEEGPGDSLEARRIIPTDA
ncbi:MAG: hypothetical protein JSV18_07095 [Candidatus Bathyarchaeota archaeon]|nr:MAG: hypothetical protein JSV18_07095 [Candidatus Bathyarchaeota archaeon]